MHSLTFQRCLQTALATGICFGMLAPSWATDSVEPVPDFPIAELSVQETVTAGKEPVAAEEEAVQTEEFLHITELLAGNGLTQDQTDALCIRLAADNSLLTLLEQGELTGPDLIYLAMSNGWASRLDRYSAWAAKYPDTAAETVVFQVNMDQDRDFYTKTKTVANPDSLTVLVNKHHFLPIEYTPKLETLGSRYGSGSLRPEAAQAFRTMADAAWAEGVSLRSVSAYRSYQQQTNLYNGYLKRDKQASVDTYAARPGASEHPTGLALDINVASTSAHFENTPAFAWLKANCAQYGFILRYDQGKESLTGYRFEPWHYRYVGTEIAKTCMEQGICYEEYLALRPEA